MQNETTLTNVIDAICDLQDEQNGILNVVKEFQENQNDMFNVIKKLQNNIIDLQKEATILAMRQDSFLTKNGKVPALNWGTFLKQVDVVALLERNFTCHI